MMEVIPGLISYGKALIVVAGVGLVLDVWRHKERFEIAARSPMFLCLAGAAHVALVSLQMTAEIVGSAFPCTMTIWASYLSFGIISTAYLLRATRLVVVYNKELRHKYKLLVKPSVQRKCMVAALTPCCVASIVIQLRFASSRRRAGACYFFEEGYSIFLPVTMLYLSATGALAKRLKETNDAFKISNEICYICVSTAITSVLRTVHITLLKYSDSWSGSDETLPPTIHDLASCSVALYVSFYRPLKVFYGAGHGRALRVVHSARRVFSGAYEDHGDLLEGHGRARDGGESSAKTKPEAWGVLQMLKNETLCTLLVDFCEQNLCGESVDFLVDVVINYESLTDPAEHFRALSKIVGEYLAQGSASEVNVSNADRNEAASWLGKREEFVSLDTEKRAHLLDRQRDEIAKMLGENLLSKFKQTEIAINAFRALSEMAGGEGGTEDEEGQDADMKSMLQASAAAEVARIQRMSRAGESTNGGTLFGLARPKVMSHNQDDFDEDTYHGSETLESYTFDGIDDH